MTTNEILSDIGKRFSQDFADAIHEEIDTLTVDVKYWKTTANDWKRTADAEKQKIAAIVSLINTYEETPIPHTEKSKRESDERVRELKSELNKLVGL